MAESGVDSDLQFAMKLQESEYLASDLLMAQQLQREFDNEYRRQNLPIVRRFDPRIFRISDDDDEDEDEDERRPEGHLPIDTPSIPIEMEDNSSLPARPQQRVSQITAEDEQLPRPLRRNTLYHRIRERRLFMNHLLNNQLPIQTDRSRSPSRPAGHRHTISQLLSNMDHMSYEEMLELDENNVSVAGLEEDEISTLPTSYFKSSDSLGKDALAASDFCTCRICLAEYEDGEKMRTLPCLHRFHSTCIDQWIMNKPCCPICRMEIKEQLNN